MELSRALEEEIPDFQEEYFQYSNQEIFQQLISKNIEDFNLLCDSNNQQQPLCHSKTTNLFFSCFTCSKDPDHAICPDCFDFIFHKNHTFLQQKKKFLQCDCGNLSKIPIIICQNHQGKYKNAQEKIQIPYHIRKNLTYLIQMCNRSLQKIFIEIKDILYKFPPLLVQYEQFVQLSHQNFILTQSLGITKKELIRAVKLHNFFFNFIIWLANLSNNISLRTFLIEIFLKKDLKTNSTILDQIFERQLIFDAQTLSASVGFEQIAKLFKFDPYFNNSLHETFFLSLDKLHFYQPTNSVLMQLLEAISKIANFNIQLINLEIYKLVFFQAQMALTNTLNLPKDLIVTLQSQMISYHINFCSKEQLEIFFLKFHSCALESLKRFEQMLFQEMSLAYSNSILAIFTHRYQSLWFQEIAYKHYQNYLSILNFDFKNQLIENSQVIEMGNGNFFFLDLVKTLGSIEKQIPSTFDISKKLKFFDVSDYQQHQQKILSLITKGFSLLREEQKTISAKRNLSRIFLYQCYLVILNKIQKSRLKQSSQILSNDIGSNQESDIGSCSQDSIDFGSSHDSSEIHTGSSQDSSGSDIGRSQYSSAHHNYKQQFLLRLYNPIACEQFLIGLLYLEYFDGGFSSPQAFYQELLNLLGIENDEDFMKIFNHLLPICVFNSIVQRFGDENLTIFSSTKTNFMPSMHSYDLAFIRLYGFLFGDQGKLNVFKEIKNIKISLQVLETNLQDYILRTLMISNLEIWNLLQSLDPNIQCPEIEESFSFFIQNFFNLNLQLKYNDIKRMSQAANLEINGSFPQQFQSICQIDTASKKFQLKKQNNIFYDPVFFDIVQYQILQYHVNQKLVEQQKSDAFIIFGSYSAHSIEYFQRRIATENSLFSDFFKYFTTNEQIQLIINNLKSTMLLPLMSYQLYYVQISAYIKLSNSTEILEVIYGILKDRGEMIKKERKIIIQMIKGLEIQFTEKKPLEENPKLENQKLKLIKKFQNKQLKAEANLVNQFAAQIEENQVDHCDLCKLTMEKNEIVIPALISKTIKQDIYQTFPFELKQYIANESQNITNWKIQGCQHQFHLQCLKTHFMQGSFSYLPLWLQFSCPICQSSNNIMFPLNSEEENYKIFFEYFIFAFIDIQEEKNQILNPKKEQLYTILFSMIFRSIMDILIDRQRYEKNNQHQICKQLIESMRYFLSIHTIEAQTITFPKENHFILDILNIIQSYILSGIDKQQFKQEISEILYKQITEISLDTMKVLFECFDLKLQNYKIHNNLKIDNFFNNIKNYDNQIINQISEQLGDNFQEFRNLYSDQFQKLDLSNQTDHFISVAVCLLCKKSCSYDILLRKLHYPNLKRHSVDHHNGCAIFIDLNTSSIILLSESTFGETDYFLYYDDLGIEADVQNYNHWKNYKLDSFKVKMLANIILHNQFCAFTLRELYKVDPLIILLR